MLEMSIGLIFGLGLVLGDVTVPCRKTAIQSMKDFEISKSIGKEWYDIAHFTNIPNWRGSEKDAPWQSKCNSLSIAETEVRYVYRLNFDFNMVNASTKTEESMSTLLKLDENDPTVMYTMYNTKDNGTNIIVETDYNTWLLSYGCYGESSYEFVSIRSRTRTLEKGIFDKLISSAVNLGFSLESMVTENQSDC